MEEILNVDQLIDFFLEMQVLERLQGHIHFVGMKKQATFHHDWSRCIDSHLLMLFSLQDLKGSW